MPQNYWWTKRHSYVTFVGDNQAHTLFQWTMGINRSHNMYFLLKFILVAA